MIKNFFLTTTFLFCSMIAWGQDSLKNTTKTTNEEIVQVNNAVTPLKLGFITESMGFELNDMLTEEVLDDLKRLKATLIVNITDFSDERAEAIDKLNKAGVPVVAWFLLPKRDKYWLNAQNAELATKRYSQFHDWTIREELNWRAVALNMEAFATDTRVVESGPLTTGKVILKRLVSAPSQEQGDLAYARLLQAIKNDNYKLINFISPYEIDNLRGNSVSWYKMNYTLDLSANQKIPCIMNYYAEDAVHSMAQIISYGSDYPTVILGSANAKLPFSKTDNPRPLRWRELTQYLTIARKYNKSAFIYGLKGCIDKGILKNLDTKMADDKLPAIRTALMEVRQERERVLLVFKILEKPGWLVLGGLIYLALAIAAFIKLFRLISKRIST